jgi:hypothetical protein
VKRLLVVLAACAHHADQPLPVAKVATVPASSVDDVVEVIELGDTVYVFGSRDVAVVRGGTVTAKGALPDRVRAASAMPSLDGDGRWIAAVTSDGKIWRVTAAAELEPIADRLGLADVAVETLASHGRTIVAGYRGGVAISTDGVHLARFDIAHDALAVARDRVAIGHDNVVELWDLAHATRTELAVPHRAVTFVEPDSPSPRLAVWGDHSLYLEDDGHLRRIGLGADPAQVVASNRLWVSVDRAWYVAGGGDLVPTALATGGRGFASPTGDLWASDRGTLARYSLERSKEDPGWQTNVAPVFQRVCSHCHLPGGSADLDLSTAASWRDNRAEIVRRVLVTRTMPPAGTELADPERHALETWLKP